MPEADSPVTDEAEGNDVEEVDVAYPDEVTPKKAEMSESKDNSRWKWTDEMVDSLIQCFYTFKSNQD